MNWSKIPQEKNSWSYYLIDIKSIISALLLYVYNYLSNDLTNAENELICSTIELSAFELEE